MTQIYICDDEPVWIEQMEQAVTAFIISSDWAVKILCRSTRPAGLLDCLMQNQTLGGIYFLDIDLKAETNGIELGAKIRNLEGFHRSQEPEVKSASSRKSISLSAISRHTCSFPTSLIVLPLNTD